MGLHSVLSTLGLEKRQGLRAEAPFKKNIDKLWPFMDPDKQATQVDMIRVERNQDLCHCTELLTVLTLVLLRRSMSVTCPGYRNFPIMTVISREKAQALPLELHEGGKY